VKIAIDDLKKAIKWLDANSNDTHVNILLIDQFMMQCKDKYEAQVEITLFEDSMMLPKIRKEDLLR
jgi:hypothetical protein